MIEINLVHHKIASNTSVLMHSLAPLRAAGKKIVFTNGCFDILHPGHVDLLSRARMLGDILILGLNSDNSVRMLNKGHGRPINTFMTRAYVAAHLESVDFVIGFEQNTPLELITTIKPDILVKGGDWTIDKIIGRKEVEENGGLVTSLPLIGGFSTTQLINKIRAIF